MQGCMHAAIYACVRMRVMYSIVYVCMFVWGQYIWQCVWMHACQCMQPWMGMGGMHARMTVCRYVRMCESMPGSMYDCMDAFMTVCTNVRMGGWMLVCVYVCICMCVHMDVLLCVSLYMCISMCMCMYVYACIYG